MRIHIPGLPPSHPWPRLTTQRWKFPGLGISRVGNLFICSSLIICSVQMSNFERFAQIAQDKWVMWANRSGCSPKMSDVRESLVFLSKSLIRSFFFCKKRAIRSENQWANSKPWKFLSCFSYCSFFESFDYFSLNFVFSLSFLISFCLTFSSFCSFFFTLLFFCPISFFFVF